LWFDDPIVKVSTYSPLAGLATGHSAEADHNVHRKSRKLLAIAGASKKRRN
jgi:hypothetical protein